MAEPDLYPVGYRLGFLGGPDGAVVLAVRRGWTEVRLEGELLAGVWDLLGGAPQFDLNAPQGRAALARHLRTTSSPTPSVAAIDADIDELHARGLAFSVDVDGEASDVRAVAEAHRLLPLLGSLGNDPRVPGLHRLGLPGQPGIRVGERAFVYWKSAADIGSLWEAAEFFAASPALDLDSSERWRDPGVQARQLLLDIRPLLMFGAAYLDTIRVSEPPLDLS